jgi:hypothetical protein
VTVNFLGCLAFGASAVGSYVVPSTGSEVNLTVVNTFTALGALCFLIGAVLMLPEGARAQATEATPTRRDQSEAGSSQP